MKRSLVGFLMVLILTGCTQLESIPFSPPQTPESWLNIQPYVELHIASRTILIVQPTSSAIVYIFGLVTMGAGLHFLRIRGMQRSRLWWGIALLLWGLGALLAGTSYEAFSYQLKCAGREICIWTSWWEIAYLLVSVASVDALLIAQAYACMEGRWRQWLIRYALINLSLYVIAGLIGVGVPIKFLISFEFLLIVSAPNIIILILLSGLRYYHYKQELDLALLGVWSWLTLTITAYFVYLVSGLTQRLWAQGIWFSENDVLHIGLLIWVLYIVLVVAGPLKDEPAAHEDIATAINIG